MKARLSVVLVAIAALLTLVSGCGRSPSHDGGPSVLAAASLQEALTEVADAWTQQGHPPPRLSFAASSALARQIDSGAPADIFISADEEWADWLEARQALKPGSRVDLLANELVLVAGVNTEAMGLDALRTGRLAVADPDVVPAGRYARAALQNLGLWQGVEERLVPAENVRAALALVERGEVPVGIVYATDALASDRVQIAHRFPSESHPSIRYPAALLSASEHPDAAAFHSFLSSDDAMRIFERHGFGTVRGDAR